MRVVKAEEIVPVIEKLCIEANCYLGEDIKNGYREGLEKEESETGKEILCQLIENAEICDRESRPICQDTGMAIVFVEIGREVFVEGNIEEAVNEGVRRGYKNGYLRKSIVRDPISRVNTNDNTPAVIHYSFVDGNKITLTVAPKGFGSENMSGIKMLAPSKGIEGVKEFVVECIKKAGSNPCPPIVIGVGIGGNFEYSAFMAKKALLRSVGERNRDNYYAELEKELLEKVNNTGIGPQGFGGRVTALDLFIEVFPTHIAGLPVAVNIGCHVNRHKTAKI